MLRHAKTYKVDLGPGGFLVLREQRETSGNFPVVYWHWLGLFKPEQIAIVILPAVLVGEVEELRATAKNFAGRFARRFVGSREQFPHLITTRDVLDWFAEQTAAGA